MALWGQPNFSHDSGLVGLSLDDVRPRHCELCEQERPTGKESCVRFGNFIKVFGKIYKGPFYRTQTRPQPIREDILASSLLQSKPISIFLCWARFRLCCLNP